MIDIHKQAGFNVLSTIQSIKDRLPALSAGLPAAVKLDVVGDRTQTIQASVDDVQYTMLITIALVVTVIFVFLRNFWATIIPSITIPLSLLGTFSVMYLLGYSLDNLSLMGLVIAVSFVVDDAIVVIENVMRHLETGKSKIQAAIDGSREVTFTIISMTISLIAVFIPILLMGGIVGRANVAHGYADALRVADQARSRQTAGPALSMVRTRLQRCHQWLWPLPRHCNPAPDTDAPCHGRGAGRDALALYDHAEGFPAAAGHRFHPGTGAGCD
jgi:Cu/Ag efflux pump CusA